MARNTSFRSGREPFARNEQVTPSNILGPFPFLNPTRAHFELQPSKQITPNQPTSSDENNEHDDTTKHTIKFLWRSRDNRKGRHALLINNHDPNNITLPHPTTQTSEILPTITRMFTHYPIWDVSWLVAYIFTWGSIVWCLNGFFSFLPYIRPSSEFPGEILDGGGITAFIGAVLFFEIGSILLMFEAINENRTGCFGWAVEQLVEDDLDTVRFRVRPSPEECIHHHRNRRNLVGASAGERDNGDLRENGKTWQWFPTWEALKTHYFRELGFLASFAQFCGATVFGIAGFTALPGIINRMSQPLTDGIYWVPQIVGGCGFIISGVLYLLETQKNWYTPSLDVLGWHIAFWNLIGGVGFTLCGALGPAVGNSGAQYQAACATFWGSFAFLIGSLLQLYESLQKHPVEVVKDK